MRFEKGAPGRPRGAKNKRTLEAVEILANLKCNPLQGMVEISRNPNASLELRGKMHSELAKYLYPQRRAIEMSGSLTVTDSLPAAIRERRRARLEAVNAPPG